MLSVIGIVGAIAKKPLPKTQKWRAAKSPGGEPGLVSVADVSLSARLGKSFNRKVRKDESHECLMDREDATG
jgi:hypothetical protein